METIILSEALIGGLHQTRALTAFGGAAFVPAFIDNETGQLQACPRHEGGVTVEHEDLRVLVRFLDSSTLHSEVFSVSRTGGHRRVTNVRAQYT